MMLRVLCYHRVADPSSTPELDPAIVSATPEAFHRQMLHVRRRYRPVSLDDVLAAYRGERAVPNRAVHVTIDDAYRDFDEIAWPILRDLDIPVTVFVPTAYADRPDRAFWWDRLHRAAVHEESVKGASGSARRVTRELRSALRGMPHDEAEKLVDRLCDELGVAAGPPARAPVLGWDELRALGREGVTFGSHTRTHAALSHVDEDRARSEIRDSLADVAARLGARARTLAYPYGIHNGSVVRIAREEGCELAFTTEDGLNDPARGDALRVRRTNITRRTSPSFFSMRMLPWFAHVDRLRHARERQRASA